MNKEGGNKLQTRVKNIEGNIDAFVQDLSAFLKLEEQAKKMKAKQEKKREREKKVPELIWINRVNQHVMLRGHYQKAVEEFLTQRSF